MDCKTVVKITAFEKDRESSSSCDLDPKTSKHTGKLKNKEGTRL